MSRPTAHRKSPSVILERLKNATPLIEALMTIAGTPGISIGVMYQGEIILSTGYGYAQVERSVPATAKTVYPLASLSKAFASAACGLLVSDGKLSWDTPISDYLPSFKPTGDTNIGNSASIIDALSHATGLKEVTSLYLGMDGSTLFPNGERTIRVINNLPVTQGDFRKTWRYNGLMYGLVGLMIEKASGMSYREFLETRILSPLGMKSTSIILSTRTQQQPQQDQMATPYIVMADGSIKDIVVSEYGHGSPLAIGCGLQSSVEDLLKWSTTIMSSYRRINGIEMSTRNDKTVLQEMQRILKPVCALPTSIGGSASYCLGWFLMRGQFIYNDIFDHLMEGAKDPLGQDLGYPAIIEEQAPRAILFHSGLFHGFSSTLHLYPESLDAVIVLGNSTGRGDAADWISRLVTAIICGDEPSPNMADLLRNEGEQQQKFWDTMESEWLLRKKQAQLTLKASERIIGTYFNNELAMAILIFRADTISRDDKSIPSPQLFVSFHKDKSHPLALHHYRDSIFSFFPSKAEFQERVMWQFHDYTQFLLHMHFEDSKERATGLWWQFERSSDGIWFGSVEDECLMDAADVHNEV